MKRFHAFLIPASLLFLCATSYAANDSGLPGEFMNFGVGARSMAMGRAHTGVADDVDSIYWNPAGLSTFRSGQVSFEYSPMPLGGAHQYLGYAQPIYNMGNIGLGVINLTSGDVPRRDINNIEVGSFDSRETGYMLSYAHKLKQSISRTISLGGSLKVVEMDMDGRKATGVGADIGTLFIHKEAYRVGAMIRNIVQPKYNFSTDDEKFPMIFRVGGSARFFENHLLAALDLDKTLGTPQGLKWHFGLEGVLIDALVIRAGLDSTEITTGVGIRWRNIQLDYAAGFQDLGLVNRTAIKFFFGGYEADVKASPRVFSPVGLKNKTTFKIKVANRQRVVSWILSIRRSGGDVVRSFQGFQAPPDRLEWDGKDAQDKVLDPGEYTYRMSVTDAKNKTELTPARSIKILGPTPFEIEAK